MKSFYFQEGKKETTIWLYSTRKWELSLWAEPPISHILVRCRHHAFLDIHGCDHLQPFVWVCSAHWDTVLHVIICSHLCEYVQHMRHSFACDHLQPLVWVCSAHWDTVLHVIICSRLCEYVQHMRHSFACDHLQPLVWVCSAHWDTVLHVIICSRLCEYVQHMRHSFACDHLQLLVWVCSAHWDTVLHAISSMSLLCGLIGWRRTLEAKIYSRTDMFSDLRLQRSKHSNNSARSSEQHTMLQQLPNLASDMMYCMITRLVR